MTGYAAQQGTSFETAISVGNGQRDIKGTTYVKYTNTTKESQQVTLFSTGCTHDAEIEAYKIDKYGQYDYWCGNDQGGDDDNFLLSREVLPGETVYYIAKAYNKTEEDDIAMKLHVAIGFLKDIVNVESVVYTPENGLTSYIEFDKNNKYAPLLTTLIIKVKYTDGTYGNLVYHTVGTWTFKADNIKRAVGSYPFDLVFEYKSKSFKIPLKYNVKSYVDTHKVTTMSVDKDITIPVNAKKEYGVYKITLAKDTFYNIVVGGKGSVALKIYNEHKELFYELSLNRDSLSSGNYFPAGTYYILSDVQNSPMTCRIYIGTDRNPEDVVVKGIPDQVYTGNAICPVPVITYKGKDVEKHYGGTIGCSYKGNVNPGRAFVCANYEFLDENNKVINGYYYMSFRIYKPIDKATVKVSDVTYTGKVVAPSVTVTLENKILIAGKDYKVTVDSNVNAGNKTLVIEGIGTYKGKITKSYTMHKAQQVIQCADTFIKNKKSKKFSLKATAPGALTYKTTAKKVAKVSKTGKVTLKKKYGVANIVIQAAETQNYNPASKTVKVVVTSKATKIASLKSSSKSKVVVKVKKVSEAKGYEISYSLDASFKTGVSTTTTSKTTTTLKKLKHKKTYYVRVRTYRKQGGKKLYSAYSPTKKVKVK